MSDTDQHDLCDCCGRIVDVEKRDTYLPTWSGDRLWIMCMPCAVRQRCPPPPAPSLVKQVDAAHALADTTLDGGSDEHLVQLSTTTRERLRAVERRQPDGPPRTMRHEGWIWLIAIVSALVTGLAMGYLLGVHP